MLFYSIKYLAIDKIAQIFFLYRIIFFIDSINDIQIRYFIFVTFCDDIVLQNILCLTKIQNSFSIERETLFSKDRSKLLCVSRENMSHRINVQIARAK